LRGSIKLFTIFGITVEINATWLIAVAIITWSLATTAYPSFFGSWSTSQYWLAGLITTLLLFISVLAHELGHSLVALSQGLKVSGITLLLFGGVSKIQGEASRPRNEFLIAFAGPAVSLIIGVILLGWSINFGSIYKNEEKLYHGVLFFTGWMNILVAGFNLLPGYPMDGGRILRSIVWAVTGNTKKATNVALRVGRVIFFVLIGWGGWQIFNGDVVGGMWIALIGWFLMSSGRNEVKAKLANRTEATFGTDAYSNFEVGMATKPMPPMIESSCPVNQMSYQGLPENSLAWMPVANNGELIGFVVRKDLDAVPIARASQVTIGEIMNSGSLRVISKREPVSEALRSMDRNRVNQLVVMDGDFVIGIVTQEDIVSALLELRTVTDPDDSRTQV
jgi:Zn-dependent protease